MKFQPGDIIVCTVDNYSGSYLKDHEYVVKNCSNSFVLTELDSKGSKTNGWWPEYFVHKKVIQVQKDTKELLCVE